VTWTRSSLLIEPPRNPGWVNRFGWIWMGLDLGEGKQQVSSRIWTAGDMHSLTRNEHS